MRRVIILNLIAGFVLAVVSFYFRYVDSSNFFILSFFSLFILIFINLVLIFTMWRKYKFFSFIPFTISLIFFPLLIFSGSTGHKIGMYNNPSCPNKYFNEDRKKELTSIAEMLLQAEDENVSQIIRKKLRGLRLEVSNINMHLNIVEFTYYRNRTIYVYAFAKDELPEIYSIRPVITEDDIISWAELAKIIKTENNPSKYNCDNIVFTPEIAYPFLTKNVDKVFVDKLAAMESLDDFMTMKKYLFLDGGGKRYREYLNFVVSKLSKEEKLKVIEVLNQHCRISSGLVEDDNISWKLETKIDSLYSYNYWLLRFGRCSRVSTRWLVGHHLKQLISDGVICVKDKEGHLQVKSNLSDQEIREIEWLQVEMMNWIYGNLMNKKEYWSNNKIKLADNWYFYND